MSSSGGLNLCLHAFTTLPPASIKWPLPKGQSMIYTMKVEN